MKLLHIADLHAGKKLYGKSRNEDLEYALEQVLNVCREEKVSVLLIAGDVFDKRNPDHESQALMLDFFARASTLNMHTVVISGNHDSYELMKAYSSLKRLSGKVHVFDRPTKDPRDSIFEYESVKIACLPYPDERVITHFHEDTQRSYAEKVVAYMKALAKHTEDARYSILITHLMLSNAQLAGSEVMYGFSYFVPAESLPETFSYIALGHVHKYQRIEKAPGKTYYCGSPYQIDFSEKETDKFANLIILGEGLARVEPVRLELKRSLVEVSLGLEDRPEVVLEPLRHRNVLVKVSLMLKMGDPYGQLKKERVAELLGEKLARLEVVPYVEGQVKQEQEEGIDLLKLYERFYTEKYGSKPSQELMDKLTNLMGRVSHETSQA